MSTVFTPVPYTDLTHTRDLSRLLRHVHARLLLCTGHPFWCQQDFVRRRNPHVCLCHPRSRAWAVAHPRGIHLVSRPGWRRRRVREALVVEPGHPGRVLHFSDTHRRPHACKPCHHAIVFLSPNTERLQLYRCLVVYNRTWFIVMFPLIIWLSTLGMLLPHLFKRHFSLHILSDLHPYIRRASLIRAY